MSLLIALYRNLGFRGSLILATTLVFFYLSVAHLFSDGVLSALGYAIAGAGIVCILLGLEWDGVAQQILTGAAGILTVVGFATAMSQSMAAGDASLQDMKEAMQCSTYDARCAEAALKRSACGEMKSLDIMRRGLTSAEIGLHAPKEVSPFIDDSTQSGSALKCPFE